MPFAYRYPTNILQYPDRTAFALAALMLSSLGTATYTCSAHAAQPLRMDIIRSPVINYNTLEAHDLVTSPEECIMDVFVLHASCPAD